MRSRSLALLLTVLLVFALPVDAEDSFVVQLAKAAGSSAAGKGAEFAVKALGGVLYNTSCKPPSSDETAVFLCGVLGSVSGKSEEEWKAEVTKKLDKMSKQLDELTTGQSQLKDQISKLDASMNYQFENIAPKAKVYDTLTNIDTLWTEYTRLIDANDVFDKAELRDFADDIAFTRKLHVALGELNTVLTKSIMEADSVLRYPYVRERQRIGNLRSWEIDPNKVYDAAEKKFMDLRMYQQKGYILYLWAAEILESQCEVDAANCRRPPISSKRFHENFEANMRQQVDAFNASLDWFLLAYSDPHYHRPNFLPMKGPEPLLRANYLTAQLVGPGEGTWGRVYSMGKGWDGKVDLSCSGKRQTVEPVLEYDVPVQDPSGSLDYWHSRVTRGVFDEVRFAKNWRVLHYRLPSAQPGPCVLLGETPGGSGVIPWTQPGTEVALVGPTEERFPFGSFLGVQRAGGSYAFVSGDWILPSQPHRVDKGDATKKDIRYEYEIVTRKDGPPYLSVFHGGRGEWSGGNTGVHHWSLLHFYSKKQIWFPDGGQVKLNWLQSYDCAKVCRNNRSSEDVVMEYEVENAKTDKGRMQALAAIYLHPQIGNAVTDPRTVLRNRAQNGVLIDRSYGDTTSETKRTLVAGNQLATLNVKSTEGYHVQYLIDFEMWTYTLGWDAVHFFHRAKLTPTALYLTQ